MSSIMTMEEINAKRNAMRTMESTTVISGTSVDVKKEIRKDADDMSIACRVIYANSSNEFFYDSECTEENAVKAEEMFNLFVKGVLAFKAGKYYKPTSCTEDGEIVFPF